MTPDNVDLTAGLTPRATTVTLQSAKQTAESRHTQIARNPLPEFCNNLKVGDNIVVRVAEEEQELNPNEHYFVARIVEKAKQLEEAETYSAVNFKKNDWIVSVQWYIFCAIQNQQARKQVLC